jgi:hypothetical protein
MPLDIPGKVQNQAIRLIRVQPHTPANNLHKQASRLGRPQEGNHVHIGRIEPCSQDTHRAEGADLTILEPGNDVGPFFFRRIAKYGFTTNAFINQHISQMAAMLNSRAKYEPMLPLLAPPNNLLNSPLVNPLNVNGIL